MLQAMKRLLVIRRVGPRTELQCDFRFGLFFLSSFRFRFANYFFVLVSF